jgi:transposase
MHKGSGGTVMRFAGIDIGSRKHVVAVVDEASAVVLRPTPFTADWRGHELLFGTLGPPVDILVAMEATGHYSRNLFGALTQKSYPVALVNPLRTRRFAEEDLVRAKTDSVDSLVIARFAAQKRPAATSLDLALEDLRELVRFHNRLLKDFGARLRQLYRLVHLCFPEFLGPMRRLDSQRATTLLAEYPTATAFAQADLEELASLRLSERRSVGSKLAQRLTEAARVSIGWHQGPAYASEVVLICRDLDTLRARIATVRSSIEDVVAAHPIGLLLTTIDSIGAITVGRILATVGDPGRFHSAGALAAYVGVAPGTKQSGTHSPVHSRLCPLGNAQLRHALFMATFGAIQRNAWLRSCYERLKANGKPPKVALVATMRKLLSAVYAVAKNQKPFVCPSAGDPSGRESQK